jgi:Asp/Glu/hydantoin racemase
MTIRLLLINPNTSAAMTALIEAETRRALSPDSTLVAVTAAFGVPYIDSRASMAIAGHAALDAFLRASAEMRQEFNAVILGCFGDPGLRALRETATCPVVCLADAACMAAAATARRFSIVTGGRSWIPILNDYVADLGLGSQLASIRAVEQTGASIAAEPHAGLAELESEVAACVSEDGAESVIIGGAGLAGVARRLAPRIDAPLIDSVMAGAIQAEAFARMKA